METTGFPLRPDPRPLLAALWLLLGAGCANGIFYQPSRQMDPAPDSRGLAYQAVAFKAADGTALTGWWLPAAGNAKGAVLHFHGNAQNMSTHVRFADWLPAAGYHLFVFDYRGYGQSAGTPSRRGLILDGMAALEEAGTRADKDSLPLFVWGQSLGGTVALQAMLRSEVPVRAAIIDSAFSSHGRIAAEKMRQLPWFLQPLRLLRPLFVSSTHNAEDALGRLDGLPILFLHGEQDRVIPASHSRRLHGKVPETSRLLIVPGAGHCDAVLRFPDQVRPVLLNFLGENAVRE